MLLDLSIRELADGLQSRKFTSEDLVRECYETIERINPSLNTFVTLIDKKESIEKARQSDAKRTAKSHTLDGIPFVMKDSYVTEGIRTTASSNILKKYIPQYSATVYKKLLATGAILIGKMNMDAWGHGATNENSDFGPVHNPWDISRVPGGSTGGVAAAISSRFAAFGIGEDTGGSIRNPAAWCNISGLKVTYGRVSRYGCIAYASSFDTVGPMGKTVEDCAIILETIAGQDTHDATTSPTDVKQYSKLLGEKKPLVLGIPRELFTSLDTDIHAALMDAIETYKKLGHTVVDISMPMISYGISVYYLIAPSETSSNLARYDGVRYGNDRGGFTDEGKRRIMLGTYALSAGYYDAYYKKAQQVRTLFKKEYEKALKECTVILMPVTPIKPTKIGELVGDPIQNWLIDVFTTTQNPVGVPSLALPCGFTKDNLPIGMQLVGDMFAEDILCNLGHAYQQVTDWHKRQPSIISNLAK